MPERMVEWALGFFATAWLGLMTLNFRGQNKKIETNTSDIKKCADKYIPRPEYEAMKDTTDQRFDRVDEGINGIHSRLDKIYENQKGV